MTSKYFGIRFSIIPVIALTTGLLLLLFPEKISATTPEIVSLTVPVQSENATLHAGPGPEYYVTGHIARGTRVEIYIRTDDGWCAVRPPQGSFSWVNAKFVRKDYDKIGVIVAENNKKSIPVRVGTDSVLKSSVIHVGLKNGDKVRILGEMTLPGGLTWYKISPPSGEFRWIHENDLANDAEIRQLPDKLTVKNRMSASPTGDETDFSGRTISQVPDSRSGVPTQDIPIAGIPMLNIGARNGSDSPDNRNSSGRNPLHLAGDTKSVDNPLDNQGFLESSPITPQEMSRDLSLSDSRTASVSQIMTDPQMSAEPTSAGDTLSGIDQEKFTLNGTPNRLPPSENGTLPVEYLTRPTAAGSTTIQRPELPDRSGNSAAVSPESEEYENSLAKQALPDKNFYMEYSYLNRDLFTAIQQSANPTVFDLLAQRAEALNAMAQCDEQRQMADELYSDIGRYKYEAEKGTLLAFSQEPLSLNQKSGFSENLSGQIELNPYNTNFYTTKNNPTVKNSQPFSQKTAQETAELQKQNFDGAYISFSPNQTVGGSSAQTTARAETAPNAKNRHRMSFAFANVRNPFKANPSGTANPTSGTTVRSGKIPSLIPEKRETLLLPPANYSPVIIGNNAGNITENTNQTATDSVSAASATTPATTVPGSIPDKQSPTTPLINRNENGNSSSAPPKTFWAEHKPRNGEQENITSNQSTGTTLITDSQPASASINTDQENNRNVRQVSWQTPKLSGENTTRNNSNSQNSTTGFQKMQSSFSGNPDGVSPTVSGNRDNRNGFDAFGVLGCLPNRPEGCPAYVLVDHIEEPRHILCYVESESGRSLDQFVGKTIGIKGTQGWFQGGKENRRLMTAKTIFAIP